MTTLPCRDTSTWNPPVRFSSTRRSSASAKRPRRCADRLRTGRHEGFFARRRDDEALVAVINLNDYLDMNVPVAARMYDRRIGGYKAIGYEIDK